MSSKDEGLILNNKVITFVKNFSYTFSSNILTMIVSALVILIVPKLIGVQEYGYWQLYMFYSFYVGFLHFGWNDGIYLRYGGQDYKDLNKRYFFSVLDAIFLSNDYIYRITSLLSILCGEFT